MRRLEDPFEILHSTADQLAGSGAMNQSLRQWPMLASSLAISKRIIFASKSSSDAARADSMIRMIRTMISNLRATLPGKLSDRQCASMLQVNINSTRTLVRLG